MPHVGDFPSLFLIPGSIMIWSGAVVDIPYGWALCNGSNGTPDLTDTFIVGAGGGGYNPGDAGGAATMPHAHAGPEHGHELEEDSTVPNKALGMGGAVGTLAGNLMLTTAGAGSETHSVKKHTTTQEGTGPTGDASNEENRPPYYALCYIMRL